MNSSIRPIFNEKVTEKWNLWVRKQCTDALFTVEKSTFAVTVHEQCMNSSRITSETRENKKKKKKKEEEEGRVYCMQL